MYGRSNRNSNGEYMNFGKSGNVIKMGAGLREQMEVANTIYYNHFSLKLIEDALYELSASKLDMGDRIFVLRTGERGAVQFHKEVLKTVSGWQTFILENSNVNAISKTSSLSIKGFNSHSVLTSIPSIVTSNSEISVRIMGSGFLTYLTVYLGEVPPSFFSVRNYFNIHTI